MTVTEVELVPASPGESFLEKNKSLVEQCAVQALMSVLNSNAPASVKLEASAQAFDILGKSKPTAQPANTTNIQLNAVLAGKAGDALAGMVKALTLMGGDSTDAEITTALKCPPNIPENP